MLDCDWSSDVCSSDLASLLRTLGLPELVTADEAGYFNLALALARDPGRLAELRARVELQRLTSPLFDTPRFTRDLERLLLAIWDQACSGRREPFVLADED
jgi:predicted O-linked N-acetylglucosamine transferase (SPINDLY family)